MEWLQTPDARRNYPRPSADTTLQPVDHATIALDAAVRLLLEASAVRLPLEHWTNRSRKSTPTAKRRTFRRVESSVRSMTRSVTRSADPIGRPNLRATISYRQRPASRTSRRLIEEVSKPKCRNRSLPGRTPEIEIKAAFADPPALDSATGERRIRRARQPRFSATGRRRVRRSVASIPRVKLRTRPTPRHEPSPSVAEKASRSQQPAPSEEPDAAVQPTAAANRSARPRAGPSPSTAKSNSEKKRFPGFPAPARPSAVHPLSRLARRTLRAVRTGPTSTRTWAT